MNKATPPYQELLRDLPLPLRKAVNTAVALCNPRYAPRLYAHDWHEELYHEALLAANIALERYNPTQGDLYTFGFRVIQRRLKRFCDKVWASARYECDYPSDPETGEEMEWEDEQSLLEVEQHLLEAEMRTALSLLSQQERQLLEWYFGEGLSERAIGGRLGCSHVAVHKRLRRAWERLCVQLGVKVAFP